MLFFVQDACGFKSSGPQTQVYRLDPQKHGNACLAGTGEMPLAAYFINSKLYEEELPKKQVQICRTCLIFSIFDILNNRFSAIHRKTAKAFHNFFNVYRVCTVSRCFRAETAEVEKGIYRVHQFYKVSSSSS